MRYSGLSLTTACLFEHNFEISGCGVRGCREGVPLMGHIFIWGFCTGGVEKPVQAETLRLPRFGELAAERTEGSYDGSHRS